MCRETVSPRVLTVRVPPVPLRASKGSAPGDEKSGCEVQLTADTILQLAERPVDPQNTWRLVHSH